MTFWEKVLKFARIATASIAALAAIIALISIRARSGPRSGTLSHIPLAINKRSNYENFEAECPHCKEWSVFNRASDLHTFEHIARRDVNCFHCHKPYRIMGDSINNLHEMLVHDCYELIERKHYMNCILILTQLTESGLLTARL